MQPELTQPSLLSRVRDPANHEAWREFEAKYRDLIVRFCRKRGLQPMDADDVLQVVMAALVQSMPKFVYDRNRGHFRSYLYRSVKNAITHLASRPQTGQRALDTSMLAAIPGEDEAAQEALWTQEWVNHHYRLALDKVRTSFDARSIEVFERSVRGEGVDQLAAAFDTTTQAVHKIRQRIRNRIRELIQQQVCEEELIDDSQASG